MTNEEKEARHLINVLEDKKFTAQGEALRTYIEELNKNINKLQEENEELKENNLSYQEELAKAWKENKELKEEILNFIPRSIYEVEFKTKLMKIIGETKDEE